MIHGKNSSIISLKYLDTGHIVRYNTSMSKSQNALSGTFYSFNVDATEVDPFSAHMVAATIVKFIDGKESEHRKWVINPQVEIPAESVKYHGITTEKAQKFGAEAKTALNEIAEHVASILRTGYTLVIFNATYHLSVLESQCNHYGVPRVQDRLRGHKVYTVIDPFVLTQGHDKFRTQEGSWGKNYSLNEVSRQYNVPFASNLGSHDNATAAGRIAVEFFTQKDAKYGSYDPHKMTELQKDWYTRIQNSLLDYFNRKGYEEAAAEIDTFWPLNPNKV